MSEKKKCRKGPPIGGMMGGMGGGGVKGPRILDYNETLLRYMDEYRYAGAFVIYWLPIIRLFHCCQNY